MALAGIIAVRSDLQWKTVQVEVTAKAEAVQVAEDDISAPFFYSKNHAASDKRLLIWRFARFKIVIFSCNVGATLHESYACDAS